MVNVPEIFKLKTHYVYPPYNNMIFEEYFYNYYISNNINIENYEYLPIFWTSFYMSKDYGRIDMNDLQIYLNQLPRNKKYFTIIQYDDGILQNIDNLDIFIFGQGGKLTKNDLKKIGYPIPLNCLPSNFTKKERNIKCSFIGVINGRHSIREKLRNELLNDNNFLISEKIDYNSFLDILEKSEFTLCPRGYGLTSFRICESLQHESIPIYVSDNFWLPFKDEFNFTDIGFLINENEIYKIKNIINISTEEKNKLLEKGKEIYKQFFDYEGCSKEIIKKICNIV
jgi:Exostosin family